MRGVLLVLPATTACAGLAGIKDVGYSDVGHSDEDAGAEASSDDSCAMTGASFCATQPSALACVDFDEPSTFYERGKARSLLGQPTTSGSGSADLPCVGYSKPAAFAASVGSTAPGSALFRLSLSLDSTRVVLVQWRFRVDALPSPPGPFYLASLHLDDGTAYGELLFDPALSSSQGYVNLHGPSGWYDHNHYFSFPAAGTWVACELKVTRGADPRFQFTIDGAVLDIAYAPTAVGQAFFEFGVSSDQAIGHAELSYDDVVVTEL
jgi:hypothetical protein